MHSVCQPIRGWAWCVEIKSSDVLPRVFFKRENMLWSSDRKTRYQRGGGTLEDKSVRARQAQTWKSHMHTMGYLKCNAMRGLFREMGQGIRKLRQPES